MSALKVIVSERGKNLIVLDGYKYRFHKQLTNGVKRWVCSVSGNKKCPAYLKTEGKSDVLVHIADNHNHQALDEKVLNRLALSNSLKRKATEDLSERPIKLIHTELRSGDVSTLTITDLKCIRKNIYHARRSVLPKLPTKLEEVHDVLKSFPCKTNRNEPFLLVNDTENNIIMFSCQSNLEFLCSLDTIYVDGTFDCCTKFFVQLFTIHGLKDDHYIPLVFFLLPNKRKSTYKIALNHVIEQADKQLTPKTVVADFEEAIQQSVLETWSGVRLIGCKFHLGQAW